MDGVTLIRVLSESIQEGDVESLKLILDKMPIVQMDINQSNDLLSYLMDQAVEFLSFDIDLRVTVIKTIYAAFVTGNPEEGKFSLLTQMLISNKFNLDTLTIVCRDLEETLAFLWDELVARDDSPDVINGLNRLFKIFGAPSYERLVKMKAQISGIELDEGVTMPRIQAFIGAWMETQSPVRPKPQYIVNLEGYESQLPNAYMLQEVEVELPTKISDLSLDEKVEILTEGLQTESITEESIEMAMQVVAKQLQSMSTDEQIALVYPGLLSRNVKALESDESLFRIFGPAHPMVGTTLSLDTDALPCQKYGGCRMLLCVCGETYSDLQNTEGADLPEDWDLYAEPEDVTWFTGVCKKCKYKIEKECYAVRMPRDSGGWKSCYCSWECVQQDTPEDQFVVANLGAEFAKQVNEIGIYDREYSLGIPTPEETE